MELAEVLLELAWLVILQPTTAPDEDRVPTSLVTHDGHPFVATPLKAYLFQEPELIETRLSHVESVLLSALPAWAINDLEKFENAAAALIDFGSYYDALGKSDHFEQLIVTVLGLMDVERILDQLSTWAKPIVETAFYTGMRRGEILSLKRKQVDLSQRMFYLGPRETKEGHWERVPIHRELGRILESIMKVQSFAHEEIFLVDGNPPYPTSVSKPWRHAVMELGLEPAPRFHDLRHTWKTNARRSGMDPEIRESIMGHWYRARNVNERYGRIGDEELVKAIDQMTFDHGKTEILVARA